MFPPSYVYIHPLLPYGCLGLLHLSTFIFQTCLCTYVGKYKLYIFIIKSIFLKLQHRIVGRSLWIQDNENNLWFAQINLIEQLISDYKLTQEHLFSLYTISITYLLKFEFNFQRVRNWYSILEWTLPINLNIVCHKYLIYVLNGELTFFTMSWIAPHIYQYN